MRDEVVAASLALWRSNRWADTRVRHFLAWPNRRLAKVVAISIIAPMIVAINWKAWKLEGKHGFDAFPDRLNLVIFCVLVALLLFSMIVAFKGNLSKMNGMVAMIGITCGIPLSGCRAFSKERKTVACIQRY